MVKSKGIPNLQGWAGCKRVWYARYSNVQICDYWLQPQWSGFGLFKRLLPIRSRAKERSAIKLIPLPIGEVCEQPNKYGINI